MDIEIESEAKMRKFGSTIGALLDGGEIIELVGDVGSGKTVLVKGIAKGLGIDENVQSPSFLIRGNYQGNHGITLAHYDFYRLDDAGIMAEALDETVHDNKTVTAIEWSNIVDKILPDDRLRINIKAVSEASRVLTLKAGGKISKELIKRLEKK